MSSTQQEASEVVGPEDSCTTEIVIEIIEQPRLSACEIHHEGKVWFSVYHDEGLNDTNDYVPVIEHLCSKSWVETHYEIVKDPEMPSGFAEVLIYALAEADAA
nr:hypothetical protein [Mycobacterium sp. UM_NZ2]